MGVVEITPCVSQSNVDAVFESKTEESLDKIRQEIESIKNDVLNKITKYLHQACVLQCYFEILRNKSHYHSTKKFRPKNSSNED